MPTLSQHVYKCLDHPKALRILSLFPGTVTDPIRCELIYTDLDKNPIYEALSYVWGPSENLVSVICDGCEAQVTSNLYVVLQHLRLSDSSRKIWVDAVCINQRDDREKSDQIRMMRDIYRKASRVVVWLGEEQETDEASHDVILRLNDYFNEQLGDNSVRKLTDDERTEARNKIHLTIHDHFSPGDWVAFGAFFGRPWFSRTWVVQELVFAQHSPSMPTIFMFGARQISWDIMRTITTVNMIGLFTLVGHPALQAPGSTTMDLICDVRNATTPTHNYPSLMGFLRATMRLQASDPRDKLFALLGMLRNEDLNDPLLRIDYKRTTQEVYTDLALYLLQSPAVHLKLFALIPDNPSADQYTLSLPSWVPDLTQTPEATMLLNHGYYKAGALPPVLLDMFYSDVPIQLTSDYRMLTLTGKVVDTITCCAPSDADLEESRIFEIRDEEQNVSRTATAYGVLYSTASYITKLLLAHHLDPGFVVEDLGEHPPMLSDDVQCATGQSLREAFWRTILADRDSNGQPPPAKPFGQYYEAWHEMKTNLEAYTGSPLEEQTLNPDFIRFEIPEEHLQLFEGAAKFQDAKSVHGVDMRRCFVITQGRRMGWVSRRARPGDKICIIFGGHVPYLIRPQGDKFEMLGECYVHGLMDGEALRDFDTEFQEINLI